MVKKKSKSKRTGLKTKYSRQKKQKEMLRKIRKEARKNPDLKRQKKMPGIPNLWPFKENMLDQIERKKDMMVEEKQRQKDDRRKQVEKRRRQMEAKNQEAGFTAKGVKKPLSEELGSRRWYFKEMKKVIEQSDVILEVLDARDPIGCRCPEVERMILGHMSEEGKSTKRVILILNKIDMIPAKAASAWIKYFRREFPTIAFKSSTQTQGKNLRVSSKKKGSKSFRAKGKNQTETETSECVGGEPLLELLKKYSRSLNLKKTITVGVIGFPKVGKSSVINSLNRSKVVSLVANAGSAKKNIKKTQPAGQDKNIALLESPGVLFAAGGDDQSLLLRNCAKFEQLKDPVDDVDKIVQRCPKTTFMAVYEIGDFANNTEFLYRYCHKHGKLGKGGVPDFDAGARAVLQDWNAGKIPFYSLPPANSNSNPAHEIMEAVSTWVQEFDMSKLLDKANVEILNVIQPEQDVSVPFTKLPASAIARYETEERKLGRHTIKQYDEQEQEEDTDNDQMEDEDEDGDEKAVPSPAPKKKQHPDQKKLQLNRKKKAEAKNKKKEAKEKRRQEKMQGDDMEEDDNAYDFNEHFEDEKDEL